VVEDARELVPNTFGVRRRCAAMPALVLLAVAACGKEPPTVAAPTLADVYDAAAAHAQAVWEAKGGIPDPIHVDLGDAAALRSPDERVRAAAARFPGWVYDVRFERSEFTFEGSSIYVVIHVRKGSDEFTAPQILTRRAPRPAK